MAEFRRITDDFFVSPQLSPADFAAAAAQGFRLVVNNRPDGESCDQLPGREAEAAARAAGLDYMALPIFGGPSEAIATALAALMDRATGPILAYCRSGARSTMAWAMAAAQSGAYTVEQLIALARAAGYDLSPARGLLERLANPS